jgi:hypothetical protein
MRSPGTDADECTMREPGPYLREAAVTLVPSLTDAQLDRIGTELDTVSSSPFLLVSRLSEHTALIQGIPVKAGSSHEADAMIWETIYERVRAALSGPFDWDTTITAIDVREPTGALAS